MSGELCGLMLIEHAVAVLPHADIVKRQARRFESHHPTLLTFLTGRSSPATMASTAAHNTSRSADRAFMSCNIASNSGTLSQCAMRSPSYENDLSRSVAPPPAPFAVGLAAAHDPQHHKRRHSMATTASQVHGLPWPKTFRSHEAASMTITTAAVNAQPCHVDGVAP